MDNDHIHDEPPPSYQEATGNPSFTHRPDSHPPPLPPRQPSNKPPPAQTFSQLLPTINRQFPTAFNLYRDAPFPGAPLQRRLFLGEHQYPPLYAIGIDPHQPAALVLHNGPSDEYPPLATAALDPHRRHAINFNLPPLAGGLSTPAVTATLASRSAFGFRIEVPAWQGNGVRHEAFEWRFGGGAAVGALGPGAGQGWVLVRLANDLPPGRRVLGPPSGDGHEVVAACTSAVLSITKVWKFCFLGTGASGALGERWAVMAVITGLVTWNRLEWM